MSRSNNRAIRRLLMGGAALAGAAIPRLRLEVLDGATPPDRMPALMNAADCLLLTSDAEGSPTVVQEALACNLRVVSVDVGDARERLRGVPGARLAARDPADIARALVDLLAVPGRGDGRRHLGEFSARRVARELDVIYRELCGRELCRPAGAPARRGSPRQMPKERHH